jgi:hypothetical protein
MNGKKITLEKKIISCLPIRKPAFPIHLCIRSLIPHTPLRLAQSTIAIDITSLPGCWDTLRAGTNEGYFDFQQSAFFAHADSRYKPVLVNVFPHRAGQPTKPAIFPWHNQLCCHHVMSQQRNVISIQDKGRLELALQAYKSGHFKRLRRAAAAFNVTHQRLSDRLHGTSS